MSKAASNPPVQAPVLRVQAPGLDVPGPLRAYLETTLGQVASVSDDPDALWQLAERGLQMEIAGKIIAGRACQQLRDSLEAPDISAELSRRMIPKSSFYQAIEVYQLFAELPDLRVVQALAQLGITKALATKKWDDKEHLALATGKEVRGITLDAAVDMSTRDLDAHLKAWQEENDDKVAKLQKDLAQSETQNDILRNQVKQLARAGAALQAEEDLPHFALVVRQEFMALTEAMSFALDNLEAIAGEHLFADVKHPERHKFQPVAAGTAYFALAGIHARAQQLLQRIEKEFKGVGGMVTTDQQLTAAEIKRFQEQRDQLVAMHQAEAKKRDDARENNRPGKRGAKRK